MEGTTHQYSQQQLNHHESGGITKRRSVKASTKEVRSGSKRQSSSPNASPSGSEPKPKKRIQVVFSPPFSLKVVQMVKGESSSKNTSGNKTTTASNTKSGGAQSASKKAGGSSSTNNCGGNSPNSNGNNINNVTNKKYKSEVPNGGAAAALEGVVVATSNIASVKNDLSASSSNCNHQKANETHLTKISHSKSSDNVDCSPQKVSNKSVNNQSKSHNSSSGKELTKSKSSSGANKNLVKSNSKKEREKVSDDLAINIDNDEIIKVESKMGNVTDENGKGNPSKNKNVNSNNVKSKVKSSGSFLQRRKQNLVKAGKGEKSELRVLIPPANQDEDEINSPITPMK